MMSDNEVAEAVPYGTALSCVEGRTEMAPPHEEARIQKRYSALPRHVEGRVDDV